VLALLTVLAFAPGPLAAGATSAPELNEQILPSAPDEPILPFDPIVARGEHVAPGTARELSKKEVWRREKMLRPDVHTTDADLSRALAAKPSKARAPSSRGKRAVALATEAAWWTGERIEPVTTLFNVWTREALPLLPGQTPAALGRRFCMFLRDHFTNQPTDMDTRLIGVLQRVAGKFDAKRIEVVSGYRSPKYNLMLRKKGHQVARHSQHMEGNAVDFRIRGIATKQVLHYVKSLRLGGVGYYPSSQFVHSDTGPIRYWTGS
jgi:hypothetical protein